MTIKQKFSDRIGATKPRPIQLESMDSSLKNSIWNLILNTVFSGESRSFNLRIKFIAERFLKIPHDDVPPIRSKDWLKLWFYQETNFWWFYYNWVEFLANHSTETLNISKKGFILEANRIFEEEAAGYRFIGDTIAPITNPSELESITDSIKASRANNLFGAEKHLYVSLELLSKKPNPDYRNSIKESISAIESLVRQITSDNSGKLSKALDKLDLKIKFHGGFKASLNSLYGYTNDENGIRHAILEETDLGFDEAKFMLVTCSALVNLIIAKANKHNLLPSS